MGFVLENAKGGAVRLLSVSRTAYVNEPRGLYMQLAQLRALLSDFWTSAWIFAGT